jgi:ribonuclease T2
MRRAGWRIAIALPLLAAAAGAAAAFEPLSGCFVADAVCPAPSSIRRPDNPGAIATEPGRTYPLLGANQAHEPSHVQIRIPEAAPRDRWVALGCGHELEVCDRPDAPPAARDYVLAASWQPAFCEAHRRTPECRSQTGDRFDASHLALHGLWPEPRGNIYCGVSRTLQSADEAGRWDELPPVDLTGETRARLATVMPGTRSDLERHEWLKHGTCSGATPEAYFAATLALMQELNASPVRTLLADRIGRHLGAAELGAAFDQGFGPAAGSRVELACEDGLVIELRLHLRGAISAPPRLAELLTAARPVAPGCAGGRIDAAGFDR